MTKKRKQLYIKWAIYFLAIIIYITGAAIQPIWDHIEPYVLGAPFSVFNIVLVQVLICLGLCLMFTTDRKLAKKEKEMRERGEKIDY
ncbi:MAG: hypothetical protein LBG50_04000 [Clostridiales Family XIII bacterium]|jgi:uncharacterized oligopeptide transporter (OPT) family protein|nr:hypothetical protein [Clostridiales Family XIII bacterium]